MNKKLIFITIFACLFLAAQSINTDGTFCKVNKEFEDTKIFTSLHEQQDYDLDKYFSGYNLQFDISVTGGNKNYYTILQGVEFISEKSFYDEDDEQIPLGSSFFQDKTDSESHFAELTQDLKKNYQVKFGTAQKTTPAFLKEKVNLPYKSNETCLDVTLIRSNIAIVDCVQFVGATAKHYFNHYYIVDTESKTNELESYMSNSSYLNFLPLNRKNLKYETTHDGITQIFLIQGVSYDLQDGDPYTTYLNIFRYVTDQNDTEGFKNGHLQVNPPITGDQLKFSSFKLSDFDVLGEWIYVLDQFQGVTFFRYRANELQDVVKHRLTASAYRRYGISVNMLGSKIQLLVAESSQIVEYTMSDYDSNPKFVDVYRLENQIMATVDLQSNANHIVLGQGRLLTVFNRGQTSLDYTKAQIQNAVLSHLWYSDNLYIFNGFTCQNVLLSEPVLRVNPKKKTDDAVITITATSYNFEKTDSCSIDLISKVISDPASKAAYYTNFPEHIEWNTQKSYATILTLGTYWVGPNISYKESLAESKVLKDSNIRFLKDNVEFQKAFLAKKETGKLPNMYGDNNVLYIDEPKRVNLSIETESNGDWYFTRVIPIPGDIEGSFYSVHQDSKYDVYIYVCVPPALLLSEVFCGSHIAKIELGTKIVTLDYGTWGDEEDILAIVREDHRRYVEFYFLQKSATEEPGELWFREDFNSSELGFGNKLQHITLDNDSLYVILQNSTERFVAITSYDTRLQVRDIIRGTDVQNWPKKPVSDQWNPQEIMVSEYHPNVIFIRCQTQIFIADVSTHQALFLNYIPLNKIIGTEIYVTKKSLVIAQADSTITDYSLQNLNWVSMSDEFKYQLYDYKFTDVFAIDVAQKSGLIYALAHSPNKKDLNLLIFRAGVESIRTLFKVINIEEDNIDIQNDKPFTLNVGGEREDFIFVQYNGKKKYFRAPVEDKIILIPRGEDKTQYVDIVEILIDVIAWDGNQRQVKHDVTLVNGQTSVIVNNELIQKSIPENGIFANGKDHAEFPQNVKGWWNGSVTGLTLTCDPNPEVCGDQITIQNIVQEKADEENKLSSRTMVIDMHTVNDTIYQLYQKSDGQDFAIGSVNNKLEVAKNDYNKVTSNDGDLVCEFLIPVMGDLTGELEHFVVICFSNSIQKYVTQVIYPSGHKQDGEIEIARFKKIQFGSLKKDQFQVFHKHLFVNAQGKTSYDGLYIFDLYNPMKSKIDGKDIWSNREIQFIDQYTFNGGAPNLNISSFFACYESLDIVVHKEKYIKVIIADSPIDKAFQPNLWFIDLEIDNDLEVKRDKIQKLGYDQFIIDHNLFVNEETRILKIQFVGLEGRIIGDTDYIDYKFIIMTDNTALYETSLVFKVATSAEDPVLRIDLNYCAILNVYNNYGDAIPYPYMSIWQNTLAVGYYNQRTKDTTLAIYELSNVKQSGTGKKIDQEEVPLHTMQGGHVYKSTFAFIGATYPFFAFALYDNPDLDYPSIISTDFKGDFALMAFDYTPNEIVIETNGDFPEQKVGVSLNSAYNAQYNAFGLKISPGSFQIDDNDDEGSGEGWIIAVSVIGGLLLLGGVGYFIWKKKQQKSGYESMKPSTMDQSSDAGYSLQEPIKA